MTTDTLRAARDALAAMLTGCRQGTEGRWGSIRMPSEECLNRAVAAIAAIDAALAQPAGSAPPAASGEAVALPVGRVRVSDGELHIHPSVRDPDDRNALKDGQYVYAAPQPPAAPAPAALLVRDIANDLGVSSLDAINALRLMGRGQYSVNMAVTDDDARALTAHFGGTAASAAQEG